MSTDLTALVMRSERRSGNEDRARVRGLGDLSHEPVFSGRELPPSRPRSELTGELFELDHGRPRPSR